MHLQWAYAIILPWVIMHTRASGSQHCPKPCVCNRSNYTMDCDGKHGGLGYIPKPPCYVKYFQLTNTNLGQITKASMANLTFCNVISLHLLHNKINNISVDALSDLNHLKEVYWEQSYFPISQFCLALMNVRSHLAKLSVISNSLDTEIVWASSFKKLPSLKNLHLSLSEMRTFNTTGLGFLKWLSKLNLSNNRLVDFSLFDFMPRLTKLKLNKNKFDSIPAFCSNTRTSLTPKLSYFNIQDNIIRILDTSGLSCLKKLQTLILDDNRITHLHNNSFADLAALKTLHLSSVTSLQFIDELAFNSSSLVQLQLAHNSRLDRKRFYPRLLFMHTQNLETLVMSYTQLKLEMEDVKAFLLSLTNIKYLDLTRTSISALPSGVFSHLTKLTILILSKNYFAGWDKRVFANVTSIKTINLEYSYIKVINESSFPVEFRLSLKQICLAYNPFYCTCDLLWFRNWMKKVLANKSISFLQYPDGYWCQSPIYNQRLDTYNPTLESCTIHQLYFVYLVISLSVCIVFTVAALVTYRYRWYILYWMSLIRRRRHPQQQDPQADMQYDGFISYSNPDWDWVSAELMDFLEGEVGLHLCEHSRDFKPGMYIVDNVIEAMEASRKTILVISNEYMKSDWCQFELQMVLSSFLKKEIDIVVILLEQIQSSEVNSALRALMVSTTYLEWSDDHEAKRLFRDRIKNAVCE